MQFQTHEMNFDAQPDAGDRWRDMMRRLHGLTCTFDERKSVNSRVEGWMLGSVGVAQASLAAQTLSPVGEELASWQGEWLFVKLVTDGHVDLRLRWDAQRFGPGSVVDPIFPFVESFPEHASVTVLRIPKASLLHGGVQHPRNGILVCTR
jgi:hypothetical protein